MICSEGIKAFRGGLRVNPLSKAIKPFCLYGDFVNRDGYWYGHGRSFGEEICEIIEDRTSFSDTQILEKFANLLDGRERGHEITEKENELANILGIAVVCGYSDDNVEFYGAIEDEIYAYGGEVVSLTRLNDGSIKASAYDDSPAADTAAYPSLWRKPDTIEALYDGVWRFHTNIPHAEFRVEDGGELFCVGIVFSVDSVVM